MPMPKSLDSYPDVKRIADSVLAHNTGCRMDFETRAQATRWAQRFYSYRSLLQKDAARQGFPPTSPYDCLVIRRPKNGPSLHIEFIDANTVPKVMFNDPSLTLVEPAPNTPSLPADEEMDDLFIAALKISKELDQ